MTQKPITLIQTGLAGLGYDPGLLDGRFGPNTRAAAEAWLAAGGRAALLKGMKFDRAVDAAIDHVNRSVPDAIKALKPTPEVLASLANAKLRAAGGAGK